MNRIYSRNPETQNKNELSFDPAPEALALGVGSNSLPCLFSNNCIEGAKNCSNHEPSDDDLQTVVALSNLLSPYRKRQAHTLFSNIKRLIEKEASSIDHVGFLTLTFPENISDPKEALERYRSMNTNFLSKWDQVKHWTCVKERQKRGAWHYHLIVVLKEDIRTGVNFEEIEKGNYNSAGSYLRSLWQELRERLPEYGFGRSELLPVKSNAEAMGRYIGKYISKHMGSRQEEDKGVRLVSYSQRWTKNSIRFAWYSKNSIEWRRKLKKFADFVGCQEFYQLHETLGTGWAYKYAEDIREIDITVWESGGAVSPDFRPTTLANVERNQERRNQNERIKQNLLSSAENAEQHDTLMREFHAKEKKAKDRSARIIKQKSRLGQLLNVKCDSSEETKERIKAEVSKDREEAPLLESYRQKAALARKLQATEETEYQNHPGLPF